MPSSPAIASRLLTIAHGRALQSPAVGLRSGTWRRSAYTLCILLCGLILGAGPRLDAQSAGREPRAGDQGGGGYTYIDTEHPVTSSGKLRLWRAYSRGGTRVILKVFRSEENRLVQVGSSALEILRPGILGIFDCHIPVSRGDYIGCYCPDVNCVDRFAAGATLLGEGDTGTIELDRLLVTTGTPAIFAVGSYNYDTPSTAGEQLMLPVVGRIIGYDASTWVTSLEVLNISGEEIRAYLYFNQSNRDNTFPAGLAIIQLPPYSTLVVEDLMLETFGLERAIGSLGLSAEGRIIAHARIADVSSPDGTYGQFVPAIPNEWAVRYDDASGGHLDTDTLYLFEIREDDDWRTNIGVTNVHSARLDVEVTAHSSDGPLGVPMHIDLERHSHTQVNRVLSRLKVPLQATGVHLRVRAMEGSRGRFFAYASRVDRHTGDAVFLLGVREPPRPDVFK